MIIIFFIYGLAFFVLGLAVILYPKKGSAFTLANNFWRLGVFGLAHGINEWLDMFCLIYPPYKDILHIISLPILVFSFLCLVKFGLKQIISTKQKFFVSNNVLPPFLLVIWAVLTLTSRDPFWYGEIWARYLLAVPGASLAAYALIFEAAVFKKENLFSVARNLNIAACAFLIYGCLGGLIVKEAEFFPASIFNYKVFIDVFGIPPQVFRAFCALVIAYAIVRVLKVFNWEARNRIIALLERVKKYDSELELRIDERTIHLVDMNEELKREVAQRKCIEEQLRESTSVLIEAQRLSSIGSWSWIVASDTVKWSVELYAISGRNPDLPPPAYAEHPSLYTAQSWEMLRQVVDRAVRFGEPYDLELDMIRPDGTIRHTEARGEVIKDQAGRVVRLHGTVQDITERKKTEAQIKFLNLRYQAILSAVPDIITEVDKNKVYTWVNKAGFEFFGEDVIGKEAAFYFVGEQETYSKVEPLFKGSEDVIYVESWQMRQDGEKCLLAWWCRVLKDSGGNVTGALSTARDITVHKKVEDILKGDKETFERMVKESSQQLVETERELDKTKRLADMGMMAASVAHELRNPLAAIQIAAYNIKKKCAGQLIDKHIFNIEKKVSESDQIINNLLFYARLKNAHYEKISIYDILEECISSAENRFKEEKVSLVRNLSEVRGLLIEADSLQMRECFTNILNNAFDAVSGKEGRIEIAAARVDSSHIEILIKDNGIGIGEEELKKVFDPFFTTKSKGTGLGLTVCSQIIYLHNGAIDIQSKEGEAACVTVVLPFKKKER
ncbi:MAG: ATP-binding protein [Candidatus Omnitrophota bacterium]|nr:ATP-binding protein [Candidatus Omnitrophota bacterium]